ncbi:hypothetical protein ALQ58_100447 [Pseudomonas syringae pv. apii]|nr:hypothetical protein ALQ58_100447 [Pseudomonas syringae pv. apii]
MCPSRPPRPARKPLPPASSWRAWADNCRRWSAISGSDHPQQPSSPVFRACLFLSSTKRHSSLQTALLQSFLTVPQDKRQVYKHINTYRGKGMNTTRWNIAVSVDTDQSLRMFLASQGGGRKGDLSRFIEEAVRAHILELSAEQAKASNAHLSEAQLTNTIDEALDWARKP